MLATAVMLMTVLLSTNRSGICLTSTPSITYAASMSVALSWNLIIVETSASLGLRNHTHLEVTTSSATANA